VTLRTAPKLLAAIALLAYPVFVWLGLSAGSPRDVALVLLLVLTPAAVIRLRKSPRAAVRGLAVLPLTMIVMLGLAAALDAREAFLVLPVASNAVLLLVFGSTLRPGSMPMIERFARLQKDELTEAQKAWCRRWTWIWCAFFVGNGGVAWLLAVFAPLSSWWAFYNGLLCYALIGALLMIEWLLRRRRFPEIRHQKAGA
jgi:uncharacterized membrane protein